METKASQREPVELLADEFLERFRRGERPALTEYAEKYPQHAAEIRELFPALVIMEQLAPGQGSSIQMPYAVGTTDSRTPQHLGEYRILREIGRGGMGVVYEAEQETLGRHVALKVLPFVSVMNTNQLARFQREARAAARLHHSNIVPVFGVGEDSGLHYFAMQYIPGQPLDEVIAEVRRLRKSPDGPGSGKSSDAVLGATILPSLSESWDCAIAAVQSRIEPAQSSTNRPSEHRGVADSTVRMRRVDLSTQADTHFYRTVAQLGLQAADALAYAHAQGILHRDIKPSNLLLETRGTLWVTDFGLAKVEGLEELTQTGDIIGTLRYMAPERLNGTADARSDVYGLGATLYELLTLKPAFDESDRIRLMRQIARDEPARPRLIDRQIPRDLETIVLKALAKEPADRYQSAALVHADLKRFLEDKPIEARRASVPQRLTLWCRRNPVVASLVATVWITLLVGVLVSTSQWRRAQHNLTRAQSQQEAAERSAADAALRQQEAESNFRIAFEAVDRYLATIGESSQLRTRGFEDVREDLLRTAQEFYERLLDVHRDDVAVRAELVRAHMRLGSIQLLLGRMDEAVEQYQAAERLLRESGIVQSNSADDRRLTANYHADMSHLLQLRGQFGEAERTLRWSIDINKSLFDSSNSIVDARSLAKDYYNLSVIQEYLGRRTEDHESASRALHINEVLLRSAPDSQLALERTAACLNRVARSHSLHGRIEQARACHERAIQIMEDLTKTYPLVVANQQSLGTFLSQFARLLRQIGQTALAETTLARGIAIQQEVVAKHPAVPSYQHDLATSHSQMSQLLLALDQFSKAEAELDKDRAIIENLAADYPGIVEYQQHLATSYILTGRFHKTMGRMNDAETWLQKGVNIMTPLVRDAAARATAVEVWSNVATDLADHYNVTSRPQKARELMTEVIATNQQLSDANPAATAFRHRVATSRLTLASSLKDERRAAEAEAEWNSAIADLERLVEQHADVVEYRYDLMGGLNSFGLLLVSLSRWTEAEELFQRSRSITQKLCDDSPDNPQYQFAMANIVNNLGIVYRNTNRRSEAAEAYAEAVRVKERLAHDYPQKLSYAVDLGGSLCNCGNAARDAAEPERSLEWYDRAEEVLSEALAREPRHSVAQRFLQSTHAGRAHGLVQLQRYNEALTAVDRAISIGVPKRTAPFRILRARILAYLGDHRGAVAAANDANKPEFGSATRLDRARVFALSLAATESDQSLTEPERETLATNYRDSAIDLLREAAQKDRIVPNDLKHTDFKSLRTAPEFLKLVRQPPAP